MTCAWSLRGCFLIQLGKKPPQAALWMFVSRSISTDHEDMLADVSDSLCGPAAATCAWSLHNFGSLLHYVKNPCKDEITCPVPAVVCNNNTTGADICRKSVRRRRADIGGTMQRHRRWRSEEHTSEEGNQNYSETTHRSLPRVHTMSQKHRPRCHDPY